jgi:hypothetical protein
MTSHGRLNRFSVQLVGSLLADELPDPTTVMVDATHVYFGTEADGAIHRCPLAGCPASGPELVVAQAGTPICLTDEPTRLMQAFVNRKR